MSDLQIALAVFVVLYAVESLYSRDFDNALTQVVFFLVPFVVLFIVVIGMVGGWQMALERVVGSSRAPRLLADGAKATFVFV